MPVLSPAERAVITLTPEQINAAASAVSQGRTLRFQSKANRDAVYRVYNPQVAGHNAKRTSCKNQLYDPKNTVEGQDIPDKGLGNDYKHHFSVLYSIEQPNGY